MTPDLRSSKSSLEVRESSPVPNPDIEDSDSVNNEDSGFTSIKVDEWWAPDLPMTIVWMNDVLIWWCDERNFLLFVIQGNLGRQSTSNSLQIPGDILRQTEADGESVTDNDTIPDLSDAETSSSQAASRTGVDIVQRNGIEQDQKANRSFNIILNKGWTN